MLIGAHVPTRDPLASAREEHADCVQFFLGNPQSWKPPVARDDAPVLRASGIPRYVHAPYLVNVASPDNRVRIPSRRILQETCDGAAQIAATAVIVHGGSVAADGDLDAGFARWRKALEQLRSDVPVLLENTAGGDHALARRFDVLARLWEVIGDLGIGFCFDTCHAHAAGEALPDAVLRARAITGRIDLMHCNDSRDELGSSRDRHTNLRKGLIHPDALLESVRLAAAPVICETPSEGRGDDLAWLRRHLGCGDQPEDSS
jgi:deoxyribonuclease IV